MEEYKMRIAIEKIRKSLTEQLEAKGANIPLFQDQIETYIFFVEREREMQNDIKERGLSFMAVSASGKEYVKDNPSVKNAIMYNKQQLDILTKLGLTTASITSDFDDEL